MTTMVNTRAEQALRAIRDYLRMWAEGGITVTLYSDDFDNAKHVYDLRTVIGIINLRCCDGLGVPIDDLGPWPKRYPIETNLERSERHVS